MLAKVKIVYLALIIINFTFCLAKIRLENDIEFDTKDMKMKHRFDPRYWFEKTERNTSIHYKLWNQSDVQFLEWPGNITKLTPDFPVLKWTKPRAKYLQNICSSEHLGMELVAYAYKYVHVTWGQFRMTRTYCPPLTVPANTIRNLSSSILNTKDTMLRVVDFGFALDALLIVTEKGFVIRISGFEMAYAEISRDSDNPLKYTLARGIDRPVDRLVTQSCCSLSIWCHHGDTILAYLEGSSQTNVFISSDGGKIFKSVPVSLPPTSSIIHSVVLYPEQSMLGVFHGNKYWGVLDKFSTNGGKLLTQSATEDKSNLTIRGHVQIKRIGNEQSMMIWDNCRIWYSYNGGNIFDKAILYIHKTIYPNETSKTNLHKITNQHCLFGEYSALAISRTGKIGFLDKNNVFFLGIDSKRPLLQLVALKTDISLLLPNKTMSLVPFFDINEGPKILYPPRFLLFPELDNVTKNYSKRAAMRLLMKSFFPSEFITVFYHERAKLPPSQKMFTFRKCRTSSLSIDKSITQKPKVYSISSTDDVVMFQLTFTSDFSSPNMLKFEPQNLKLLDVQTKLLSSTRINEHEDEAILYRFEYNVTIKFRNSVGIRSTFLLNFFTTKSLRCNYQPQQPVWILRNTSAHPELTIHREINRDDYALLTPEIVEYDPNSKKQCDGDGSTKSCKQCGDDGLSWKERFGNLKIKFGDNIAMEKMDELRK